MMIIEPAGPRYSELCNAVINKKVRVDMANLYNLRIGKNALLIDRLNGGVEVYNALTDECAIFYVKNKTAYHHRMRAQALADIYFDKLEALK